MPLTPAVRTQCLEQEEPLKEGDALATDITKIVANRFVEKMRGHNTPQKTRDTDLHLRQTLKLRTGGK